MDHRPGRPRRRPADRHRGRRRGEPLPCDLASQQHPERPAYAEGQRLFDIAYLSDRIKLSPVTLSEGGVLVIIDPEGIEDRFEAGWLHDHRLDQDPGTAAYFAPALWASDLQGALEYADKDALNSALHVIDAHL